MFFKVAILSKKKDECINNFGTGVTPYSELRFDALIKEIESGEAEKVTITNFDRVSCAKMFEFCI